MKLSDHLVSDAREAADTLSRSIAGQVEHWARLGRAVECVINGDQALELARTGKGVSLSQALALVGQKEGHQALQHVLKSRPYPHYEEYPDHSGRIIRVDADGSRTSGRFIKRRFVADTDTDTD